MPFLSINAHLYLQVHSVGCSRLQNRCQLHYHAADTALTSWYSLISQQIWNTIFITLAVLHIPLKIQKLRIGKRRRYIDISGWQSFDLGTLSSLMPTGWCKWRSRQRWHRFWCRRSISVWWWCTHSIAPSAGHKILWCAILARNAAISSIITNHSQVSCYHSLAISMPRTLNFSLPLFLDFGAKIPHQVLGFLYCGTQNL